jgi:hypothetical protein
MLAFSLIVLASAGTASPDEPGGGEETGGNNLATPVIFAEGYGLSGISVVTGDPTTTGMPGLLKSECGLAEYWGNSGGHTVEFPVGTEPTMYELHIDGTAYAEAEGQTPADAGKYFLQPYTLDPLDGSSSTEFGMETCWEADWADGSLIDTVEIDSLDVGDSLVRVLRSESNNPIRVEFTLYQTTGTEGEFQDGTLLDGYTMTQLWPPGFSDGKPPTVGEGDRLEVWGVANVGGSAVKAPADLASVFTQNARLTIDRLTWTELPDTFGDGNLEGYPTGVIPDTFEGGYSSWVDSVEFDGVVGGGEGEGGFSAEVNQGGRALYGYNWGVGQGVESGWYRLTLSIDAVANDVAANALITGVNPADQLADESDSGSDAGSKGFFPPAFVEDAQHGNYVIVDVYVAEGGHGGGGGGGGEGGHGNMTGKVTSENGTALEGKTVTAYSGSGAPAGQTETDVDGSFAMNLVPGTYKIGVTDGQGNYHGEFFDDRAVLESADDIVVTGGETAYIEIELAEVDEPTGGGGGGGGGSVITPAAPIPGCGFGDVDASNIFCAEIQWMLQQGITSGCAEGKFCPKAVATRAQIASMFVRALGLTETGDGDAFGDDNGSVHERDINRLAYAGITVGCGEGNYCPDEPMTRAQMASMFARAFKLTAGADIDHFGDDDGSVHEQNINCIAQAGITLGCGENQFCPDGLMLREQLAAFFQQAHREIRPLVDLRSCIAGRTRSRARSCPDCGNPEHNGPTDRSELRTTAIWRAGHSRGGFRTTRRRSHVHRAQRRSGGYCAGRAPRGRRGFRAWRVFGPCGRI